MDRLFSFERILGKKNKTADSLERETAALSCYLPDIYVFQEETKYGIFTGISKAIKENEVMSGDNYSLCDIGTDYYVFQCLQIMPLVKNQVTFLLRIFLLP